MRNTDDLDHLVEERDRREAEEARLVEERRERQMREMQELARRGGHSLRVLMFLLVGYLLVGILNGLLDIRDHWYIERDLRHLQQELPVRPRISPPRV